MQREGLDVTALHCYSWFTRRKFRDFDMLPECDDFRGFTRLNVNVSEEHTRILLKPVYGYGSAANPCIDCKLLFFTKAREIMDELGADFIATGEVLGQRPMTQRRDSMRLIEKKSGLDGLVLRPLCALNLEPTVPESEGWVRRERLYDIQGRGRKRQMALARQFGIDQYPSPAGGCLVTEKSFQRRFQDLLDHQESIGMLDLILLKYGRHFRISDRCKQVVGKNEVENDYLRNFERDGWVSIDIVDPVGPFSLLQWDGSPSSLRLALEIVSRYCLHKSKKGQVILRVSGPASHKTFTYGDTPDFTRIESLIIR
jgi:hypothetical protein